MLRRRAAGGASDVGKDAPHSSLPDEKRADGSAGRRTTADGAHSGVKAGRGPIATIDALVTTHEAWIPWLLGAVAAFTRFYLIWQPPGVAFDESHFVRFTNQYTAGTYFFDIHPPLGKLTLWAVGRLVGYNDPDARTRPFMSLPSDCTFEHISQDYPEGCKYVPLRCVAATVSTATVVLLYLIARRFGLSVWGGLAAGGLLLFDMLANIQGRLVLLDSQLSFWTMAALYSAQLWWARLEESHDAEDVALAAQGRLPGASVPLFAPAHASSAGAGSGEKAGPLAAVLGCLSGSSAGPSSEGSGGDSSGLRASASAPALAELEDDDLAAPTPSVSGPLGGGGAGSGPMMPTAAYAAGFDTWNRGQGAYGATPRAATPRLLTGTERNLWCLWMGFVCTNAFSVKMTGLATPGMIAVESFFALFFLRRGAPFSDLLKILSVAFVTYATWFAVHFSLLHRHGDGDEEFMSLQFQSTLLESKYYDPLAKWEGFWYWLFEINKRMVVHNANILAPHPWQSSWWEWVLNLRGVSYYGRDLPFTFTAHMYLIGNHAVHWAVVIAVAAFLLLGGLYLRFRGNLPALDTPRSAAVAALAAGRTWMGRVPLAALRAVEDGTAGEAPLLAGSDSRRHRRFFAVGMFCLLAYAVNLAPYIGVARSTFIYHYMPALLYGELLVAAVVEQLAGMHTPTAVKMLLAVVGGVWVHYSPWIYGFPLTNDGHQIRRWNPRWD